MKGKKIIICALLATLTLEGILEYYNRGISNITNLVKEDSKPFLSVVDEKKYEEISNQIKELGYTIDERYSRFVPGSKRLVIHIDDIHKDGFLEEREKQRKKNFETINTFLRNIGVGAIGIENIVGNVEEKDIERMKKDREKYYKYMESKLKELDERAKKYADLMLSSSAREILNPETVRFLFQSVADAVLTIDDKRDTTYIECAPYAFEFFGRVPLFGLEESKTNISSMNYDSGASLSNHRITLSNLINSLFSISSKFGGDSKFTEAYNEVMVGYNLLVAEIERYRKLIIEPGVLGFNPEGLNKIMNNNRNQTWADAVAERAIPIVVTVGGDAHDQGFCEALRDRKISSIFLKIEEPQ